MLLAVDIGNTQTAIGLYRASLLERMWRIKTNRCDTADELLLKIASLIRLEGLSLGDVTLASLASVVPQLTESWMRALANGAGVETVVCTAENAGELFKCKYPNPCEIGADRIADAVAAVEAYGSPVVVADFGTATNVEVIDSDGFFLGGIIAPGIQTSAQALFSHGARLSTVDLRSPMNAIGDSTEEALRSGIVLGEAERIDGLARRVFKQLGYEAPVVATGGLASLVAKHSAVISHVNPELTIEGLRLIAEHYRERGDRSMVAERTRSRCDRVAVFRLRTFKESESE